MRHTSPAPLLTNPISRYFFWGLFFFSLTLGFLLVRPFLAQIFWAFALYIVLKPIYLKLFKLLRQKKIISSVIATLLILVMIIIPLFFIVKMVTTQAFTLYQEFSTGLDSGEFKKTLAYDLNLINRTIAKFLPSHLKGSFQVEKQISGIIQSLSQYIYQLSAGLVKGIFYWLTGLLMVLFITFFLFMDGERFLNKVRLLSPLEFSIYDELMMVTEETIKATLLSSVVIALLQGVLGGLGFWIFGINSFAVWGTLMVFASLIPLIGTALIWVPASIILALMGDLFSGIGLFLYGTIIIAGSDNAVRPFLIRGKLKIHPLFIFLAVLGGILLFGFSGLVLGPLILSFILSFLKVYKDHLLQRPAELLVEGEEDIALPDEAPDSGKDPQK